MPTEIVLLPYAPARRIRISGTDQTQGSWVCRELGPAEFILEPRNQTDVLVHHPDGEHAGHLHRELATLYIHLITHFWQNEGRPVVQGTIERTRDGLGGVLHLPVADRLAAWSLASVEDRPSVTVTTIKIRLRSTSEMKAHLEVLARRRRASAHDGYVFVEETPSGKYAGLPRLTFTVAGSIVGVVTNPDLERVPDWGKLRKWGDPWPTEITVWRDPQGSSITAEADLHLPG